jgi:catechol 2,3-dioxygenase-like lactoylglutathione lyase family enzyme
MTPLLQVFDMPTSIRFFRDVLGFEVVETSEPGDDCDWALLALRGVKIMLNTAYEREHRPPAPQPARIAVHEDTALFFALEDLDGAYAYLRSKGVDAEAPKVAPYGMKQLYLKDPDGYVLCFQWPATPAWAERYGWKDAGGG